MRSETPTSHQPLGVLHSDRGCYTPPTYADSPSALEAPEQRRPRQYSGRGSAVDIRAHATPFRICAVHEATVSPNPPCYVCAGDMAAARLHSLLLGRAGREAAHILSDEVQGTGCCDKSDEARRCGFRRTPWERHPEG